MRLLPTLTLTLCVITGFACPEARADQDAILAEPSAVTPGQTVTLKWYFTGDKVVVSGGRFGQGQVVTGRQSLTDRPTRTTCYVFDVTYHAPASATSAGAAQPQATAKLHTRYKVEVGVYHLPPMQDYRSSIGWHVSYTKGWQCVNVPTTDTKKDGLVFFQPEDDSVERLAIAVLPAQDMTTDDLVKRVQGDMPSHYTQISGLTQMPITFHNIPAVLTRFTGMDESHPDTRTTSIVLIFVQDGRGYVVSGRTMASLFKTHGPILERMVRSFAPHDSTASLP